MLETVGHIVLLEEELYTIIYKKGIVELKIFYVPEGT